MAAISKQEYLKRYLSNSEGEKKKKRKKVPKASSRYPKYIIVDDDIDIRDIKVHDSAQDVNELEGDVDEAPAVFEEDGITKVSIESFKKREEDHRNKWAPISRATQLYREEEDRLNFESENPTPRITGRKRLDTPDLSPRLGGGVYNSDQSPPRKKSSHRAVRDSPSVHNGRQDTSPVADQSPPRARRRRHDSGDSLPEQSQDHSLDSPRLQESPNRSPVRRRRNDSSDLSPPRSELNKELDQSPLRKRANSESDQSPVRKRANSESDQSPPRKHGNGDSDQSPPRRQKKPDRRDIRTESGKQKRADKHEERMASG